jgi:hypothetical protein
MRMEILATVCSAAGHTNLNFAGISIRKSQSIPYLIGIITFYVGKLRVWYIVLG